MNELEKWLADVKAHNTDVEKFLPGEKVFSDNRARLEVRGRALGLKLSKIKSMLARVKMKVEMPETEEPGK